MERLYYIGLDHWAGAGNRSQPRYAFRK